MGINRISGDQKSNDEKDRDAMIVALSDVGFDIFQVPDSDNYLATVKGKSPDECGPFEIFHGNLEEMFVFTVGAKSGFKAAHALGQTKTTMQYATREEVNPN